MVSGGIGTPGYVCTPPGGQAWSVAVRLRIRSTWAGSIVTPPLRLSRLPYSATISAATPTACGEAIEVPWMYW